MNAPPSTPPQPTAVRRTSAFASLADLSIRRPVFAWMLMAALIIFGAIGLSRLGVSEQPDVDFPVLTINATWSGSAPEVMETEIVDKIEEQVISTQGVRNVTSQIQQGQASITLEFEIDRNIDAALTEVQSKLSNVSLPIGADSPTIVKSNPEDQPILLLSASSTSRDMHALTEYLELNIVDQLKILPGVGEVTLAGYQQRNLRVWVDNNKLKPLQLTMLDVKTALETEQVEEAAGYLENSASEFNVRTMGEGVTPEAVGGIQIKKRGGEAIYNSTIRIRDVARVEDGLDDVRHTAIVNGKPGIGIGIKKQHGANSVAIAQAVKARLDELRKTLPPDIRIDVNFDSSVFIQDAIHETEFTLVLSAIITSLVCFLFLGSWSSTFNVLLSIPTSVMGTFAVLYFMGFTLNFFTLLGLSLAIGIVVDDAIMVLENIVRHREMGKSKVLASRDGAREITFAALAATVAVVAIFLPVAFMSGIIGRFFFQFGITISAAVLLSLVEALTVTPMRCSQFMGNTRRGYARWAAGEFDKIGQVYRRILGVCLDHRWLVILASTAIFLLSLGIAYLLPKEFLPRQDQSAFLIRVQTPVRSSIAFTEGRLVEAEKILDRHPEIDHFFSAIGGFTSDTGAADGAVTDGQVNSALIYVTLKPKSRRVLGQFALMDKLRVELNAIPGVSAVPQDLASHDFIAGRGFPIELNLRGPDYTVLEKQSEKIVAAMKETGDFRDIDTDFRTGMPEVRIYPDRALATLSGVTVDAIASTVQAAIGGAVQGKFTNKDRRYDVRLRLEGGQRLSPGDIMNLDVRTDYGRHLPDHRPDPARAVHLHLRQHRAGQIAGRRARPRRGHREKQPASGLPRVSRRRRADFPRNIRQPLLRSLAGRRRFLHGAGVAVQQLHPSVRRPALAAVLRQRGVLRPVAHGPIDQSLQPDRPRPADGHREEELDPARRVHQRETVRGRLFRPRRDPLRRTGEVASDPDDLARDAGGGGASRAGPWAGSGKPHSDGAHGDRRRDRLDLLHAAGGALRL